MNLIGIPVAATGLILGFAFSQSTQFIEQRSLGLDIHIILSLSAYAVLLMATIQAVILWFQDRELKNKQKKRFWVNLLPSFQAMKSLLFDLIKTGFLFTNRGVGVWFSLLSITFLPNIWHIKPLLVLFLGLCMGLCSSDITVLVGAVKRLFVLP